MKRFLIFVFVILFTTIVYPESKDFSRWTFSAEGGLNKFDGDISQASVSVFPTSVTSATYGANVEYAINPIWGISLDGYYLPFKGHYSSPAADISTQLYNSNISATINFTRLIFPQSNSKIYVCGSLGLGFAYYKYNVIPANFVLDPGYGMAGSVPFTFSIEYNISKSIALGLKAHYIAYTKDNLEGVISRSYQGVTNDRIAALTAFVSYKIGANKKDHLRNIRMNEFSPDEGLSLAKLNSDRINKLDKELKKLDKKVDYQGRRIDSIAKFLSNDGPDSDGDGVPDVRDMDPNTPPNTPVDFWGKALPQNNETKTYTSISTSNCDDVPAVYFNFDRADLDNGALETISKIAAKMKADPNLYVEVRGYCDYIGKNPYNEGLSKRRAERVKAEFVKIWKIPADHIIANGKGKIIEPRIKYRPNRRCDFFFDKQ